MSEKRYFKLLSGRHIIGEKNNYTILFDVLDKLDEEDENKIKASLLSKKVSISYYSADKNYLYGQILKSLSEFHHSRTYNLEIKELLISIEILFHKGLYHDCLKLVKRAEQISKWSENFSLLLEILNWKKKCLGYSMGLEKAAAVNQEMKYYINILNDLKKVTDLYYESYQLQTKYEKRPDKETLLRFKKIIDTKEIKTVNNSLSFQSGVYRSLILSHYYSVTDNKLKESKVLEELIEDLNKNPIYKIENPLDYISIFNRLLEVKKKLRDKDFLGYINELRVFPKEVKIHKEAVQERVFIHCNTNELDYYFAMNDYEKTYSKIKEIEKEIQQFKFSIEPYHLIYFYYINAISLLFLGENRKALKFIFNVLNKFNINARPQAYRRLELLNIIAHFELGNKDLVNSLSKKLFSDEKQNELLYEFEKNLIKTINEVAGMTIAQKKNNSKEKWTTLLKTFQELKMKKINGETELINNYEKWVLKKTQ